MDFQTALNAFATQLQAFMDAHRVANFPNMSRELVRIDPGGKKYVRVCYNGSAYCFIEKATGDILKPASFKAPAKHARGNIYGENPIAGCGPYGVAYLR